MMTPVCIAPLARPQDSRSQVPIRWRPSGSCLSSFSPPTPAASNAAGAAGVSRRGPLGAPQNIWIYDEEGERLPAGTQAMERLVCGRRRWRSPGEHMRVVTALDPTGLSLLTVPERAGFELCSCGRAWTTGVALLSFASTLPMTRVSDPRAHPLFKAGALATSCTRLKGDSCTSVHCRGNPLLPSL